MYLYTFLHICIRKCYENFKTFLKLVFPSIPPPPPPPPFFLIKKKLFFSFVLHLHMSMPLSLFWFFCRSLYFILHFHQSSSSVFSLTPSHSGFLPRSLCCLLLSPPIFAFCSSSPSSSSSSSSFSSYLQLIHAFHSSSSFQHLRLRTSAASSFQLWSRHRFHPYFRLIKPPPPTSPPPSSFSSSSPPPVSLFFSSFLLSSSSSPPPPPPFVDDESNDSDWQFFDRTRCWVKGGDGGSGCVAFRREPFTPRGGPFGGNGGNGGSVFIVGNRGMRTLRDRMIESHHIIAEDGKNGLGSRKHGKNGKDLLFEVPMGTIVRDNEGRVLGEALLESQKILVAKGGRGGRGNYAFKTHRRTTPQFCEKAELAMGMWISLEVKLIADVGVVGLPNAGKSTLLKAVSNATPKIADYPFTTVVPNLGVCKFPEVVEEGIGEQEGLVLADVPGLLEGAHRGVGMGLAFLRHVERCRVIIHLLDGKASDPLRQFTAVNEELQYYSNELAKKPQVVVVNKIDENEVRLKIGGLFQSLRRVANHTRLFCISAKTGENVVSLMIRIQKLLNSLSKPSPPPLLLLDRENNITSNECEEVRKPMTTATSITSSSSFQEEDDDDDDDDLILHPPPTFAVFGNGKKTTPYVVEGADVQRLAEMTNWQYRQGEKRFWAILESMGVMRELRKIGAQPGDEVYVGKFCLNIPETLDQIFAASFLPINGDEKPPPPPMTTSKRSDDVLRRIRLRKKSQMESRTIWKTRRLKKLG